MNKPTNNINFIVVQVDQDCDHCDHVEGVNYIKNCIRRISSVKM